MKLSPKGRRRRHDTVVQGDLVAVHCTMHGRQVGPFVTYDDDGQVERGFPPTGRTFAITQSHWFRIADGLAIAAMMPADGASRTSRHPFPGPDGG